LVTLFSDAPIRHYRTTMIESLNLYWKLSHSLFTY